MPTEAYHGRLVCDGDGNLLADEGKKKGKPVAFDHETGGYIYIADGALSHNERHANGNVPQISGTGFKVEQHTGEYDDDGMPIMETVPEEGDPTVTGHTEAYRV